MSFGFIQLFFFISLGIVLSLILLLCYYLKNKIDALEKQSGSFRDILSNLIKEIKNHFLEHEQITENIEKNINKEKPIQEQENQINSNNNITIHIDDLEKEEKEKEKEKLNEHIHSNLCNHSKEWNFFIDKIINPQKGLFQEYEEESEPEIIQFSETETTFEIQPDSILSDWINEQPTIVTESLEQPTIVTESLEQPTIVTESLEQPTIVTELEFIPDTMTITESSEISRDEINLDEIVFEKSIRKMSLSQLKKYVLEHNLALYVNKMKKEDLIRLIEEKQ